MVNYVLQQSSPFVASAFCKSVVKKQQQEKSRPQLMKAVDLQTMIGLVNNGEIVRKIQQQNTLFLTFLSSFHKLPEYLPIDRFSVP